MAKLKIAGILILILAWAVLSQFSAHVVQAGRLPQIPTVDVPTVTGTPPGPMVTVRTDTGNDQINVRGGPSTNYETVGVLIAGQQAPALGRTRGGDWVKIAYPGAPDGAGWVYSPYVDLSGEVPIIEPPPTPTPQTTPTIDPTLAAQFIVELPPTRLPTFTPPPPLVIPTFEAEDVHSGSGGVPMGFVIIGLGVVGLFGTLISLLRGR